MMYWNAAGYTPGSWGLDSRNSWAAARTVSNRANRASQVDIVTYALPTNKGESQQLTLALSKPMTENWGWMVAYTYTNATEVNPLTSAQASSNWNNNAIFQANEEVASQTSYTIRDRFSANLSYRHYFFENYATDFGLFYEGRSGKPYSWVFQNDMNGDGVVNDLFYVPSAPGDVIFADTNPNIDEEAAFLNTCPTHLNWRVLLVRLWVAIPSATSGSTSSMSASVRNCPASLVTTRRKSRWTSSTLVT